MVVRVEDLLDEAQKEGDGDVAEAEVHMGVEDRAGGKRRITSVCLSPSQGLKTSYLGAIAKLKTRSWLFCSCATRSPCVRRAVSCSYIPPVQRWGRTEVTGRRAACLLSSRAWILLVLARASLGTVAVQTLGLVVAYSTAEMNFSTKSALRRNCC